MKLAVTLFAFFLACLPAVTQGTLYENGPVNGQIDAWTINFGYAVTDSAQVSGTVGAFSFWAWLAPGDTLTNIQLSIGSTPYGTDLFNSFVNITSSSNCFSNNFGYNVCDESGSFAGPSLNGNYWLTLQNANVPSGDPVYWDENSGVGCQSPGCPSIAQESSIGSIPSEAFTLGGCGVDSPLCTTTTNSTPEPSTVLLLLSGMLGAGGMLRRQRRF